MKIIKTPNAEFTGTRAGVAFSNGVGQTDDAAALVSFHRHGYSIEDAEPEGEPEDAKSNPEADAKGDPEKQEDAKSNPEADAKGDPEKQEDEAPAGNASREDWAAYAKSKGFDVLEEWKRDDIKALFQGEPEQD